MLQGLINRAQRAVDTLVTNLLTRVAVAVPFVIALGFGTAAATVLLIDAYGSMAGYAIMAAIYAAIGFVAALLVSSNMPDDTSAADEDASSSSESARPNEQPTSAQAGFATPDMIMAALATAGPTAMPAVIRIVAKLLVKNLPLLLAASLMAYLLFSERNEPPTERRHAPFPAE